MHTAALEQPAARESRPGSTTCRFAQSPPARNRRSPPSSRGRYSGKRSRHHDEPDCSVKTGESFDPEVGSTCSRRRRGAGESRVESSALGRDGRLVRLARICRRRRRVLGTQDPQQSQGRELHHRRWAVLRADRSHDYRLQGTLVPRPVGWYLIDGLMEPAGRSRPCFASSRGTVGSFAPTQVLRATQRQLLQATSTWTPTPTASVTRLDGWRLRRATRRSSAACATTPSTNARPRTTPPPFAATRNLRPERSARAAPEPIRCLAISRRST